MEFFVTIGAIDEKRRIFFKMPKEAGKIGYTEKDWMAITGLPPYGLKAYSSTHLVEVEKEDKEIADTFEKLSKIFKAFQKLSEEKFKDALKI